MAVNVSNIEIVWYDSTPAGLVELSRRASADSFSKGDLCHDSAASKAGTTDVVASADKSAFQGVSMSTIDGGADTVSKVLIAMKAVLNVPLLAGETTIYHGEAAAWSAGANGTEWELVNTSTEAVMHCIDGSIAASATGRFIIDPYTVRAVTLYGYFEVQA